MAKRHIEAWSAFMTIYHSKTERRYFEIKVVQKRDEIMAVPGNAEEVGVTAKQLASVLGSSTQTARRRFTVFERLELAEPVVTGEGSAPTVWKPANIYPGEVFEMLRSQ